jgi:hypothetical protein
MLRDDLPTLPHKVSMHSAVQGVIQFMQDNVSPYHFISVARAVAGLAPVLWGHHRQDEIRPLSVTVDVGALIGEDSKSQSSQAVATQSACRADRDLDGYGAPDQEGNLLP